MARKTYEEINEIKQALGVKTLWSYSRYDKYKSDPYGYMLNYIKHVKEDRKDSIYAEIGTECHNILDEYLEGNMTQSDMLSEFQTKAVEFSIMGLKYSRSDEEQNASIAKKYEANVEHFFKHYHKRENTKYLLEPFTLVKMSDKNFFSGYIDCIEKDNNGDIIITDFKTSSMYKGQDLIDHSKQLKIYAKGVHQKTNIPYSNIKIRFLFLKYINASYIQKNGKSKTRTLERYNYAEQLAAALRTIFSNYDYEKEDIENYLNQCAMENSLECLPREIKEKITLEDCYVYVPYTEQDIEDLTNEINDTIEEINQKTKEYYATTSEEKRDKIFWKDVDKQSSYFFSNLSGYSAKLHKPYAAYLSEQGLFLTNTNDNPSCENAMSSQEITNQDIDDLLRDMGL